MISAATNMAQLINLLVPGFIMFFSTKRYFPMLDLAWENINSGSGNIYGSIIEILFFSLAYGVTILSLTYSITTIFYMYKTKGHVDLKKIYGSGVSGEAIVSIRNLNQIHQMMFNMFVVGVVGFLIIIFGVAPESSNNLVRLVIVFLFLLSTGFASWVSANSVVKMIYYISECDDLESDQHD